MANADDSPVELNEETIRFLCSLYFEYADNNHNLGSDSRHQRISEQEILQVFRSIDRILLDNGEKIDSLCIKFTPDLATIHPKFHKVLTQTFRDGITWSRFLTAVAFSYKLAKHVQSKGMEDASDIVTSGLSLIHI